MPASGVVNPLDENDNIALLEERAARAKRDAQANRKQIPPFVQKLGRLVALHHPATVMAGQINTALWFANIAAHIPASSTKRRIRT